MLDDLRSVSIDKNSLNPCICADKWWKLAKYLAQIAWEFLIHALARISYPCMCAEVADWII